VEEVFCAIGRAPDTNRFDIENTGVKLDSQGNVIVDEFQNTSVKNIFAIGDCIGKVQLTPVAIREGRILAERIYNGMTDLKIDYSNLGTVIFSHPPVGTCGLSEEEAVKQYGADNIEVHKTSFRNMWYALCAPEVKQPMFFKFISVKNEKSR
jgi:glutathione reductase (NADPH)